MSKATVEIDFFGIKDPIDTGLRPMERRNSFRDIQSAISRIDPQLLRSVITFGAAPPGATPFVYDAGAPRVVDEGGLDFFSPPPSPLPVLNQCYRSDKESATGTAPLTIFYNGTVSVFDVTSHKAAAIMKVAVEGSVVDGGDRPELCRDAGLLEKFEGDLPIARKKSLQRFLERRKGRLTDVGPYGNGTSYWW